MNPRVLSVLGLGVILLVSGCAPSADPGTTPAATAAAESPTPTPSASPEVPDRLVVGIDGITFEGDGAVQEFPYEADGEDLLSFVEDLTGEPRQGTVIEDPWGQGTVSGNLYEWPEIGVSVFENYLSVRVLAPRVGGVEASTEEGISVGSTRAEVLAADGWNDHDSDGDGVAETLGIGRRETPGVESLTRPGEVGIEYVLLTASGDAISQLLAPANDYGDI